MAGRKSNVDVSSYRICAQTSKIMGEALEAEADRLGLRVPEILRRIILDWMDARGNLSHSTQDKFAIAIKKRCDERKTFHKTPTAAPEPIKGKIEQSSQDDKENQPQPAAEHQKVNQDLQTPDTEQNKAPWDEEDIY